MATAQRTLNALLLVRRAVWQPKSALCHSVSTAPRTIIFYIFFTIIAGELFLYVLPSMVLQWLVINCNMN